MNIVNRIVIIIVLVLVLVGVTAVGLFPDPFIARLVSFIDWLELDGLEARLELVHRLILIGVAAIVDIVLLLFLVLELRRPKAKAVRVQQVDGGTAMLTADSIRGRLGFYIDGLEDVVSVKPKVQIKRDKVMVAVDVRTSATVNVPAKAQEVVSIIRMVVLETLGLELSGEPQVNIKTGSYKAASLPEALPDEEE
jgi:hypothetical protein